jgi:hypothetical protein
MKTRATAISALVLLLTVSCSEVDKLLTFNLSYTTTFKINDGLPINLPFDVSTMDVTTNSTIKFNDYNTNADLVKDIKLEELKLSINNPDDKTFSFLKSVHVYISTNGTDETELAFLDNINDTTQDINLICTSQKLDRYVKASSYKIRTSVITKESLNQEVTVKANLKFKITADPFNSN